MKGDIMKRSKNSKAQAKKVTRINWMFFVLLFIAAPPFVCAEIHPYITVDEEYSSNIFLTDRNKIDDFITTIYPGLKLSTLKENAYEINLDFVAGYVFYAKNHELNYFKPSGLLNAWYAMNPFTFRVREYLVRSDAARESLYTVGALPDEFVLSTERGEQAIYIRNVVEPSIEYRFGRENLFSVLYRNNIYHNQNPLYEDSQENTINPKLTYWFNINNGVYLEYALMLGDFERSPDLIGHTALGRYTYRFSPRTSIFGEYVYLRRDFDQPSVDYDVHRPSLGIEHAFSPTLSAKVQGGYYWQVPEKGSTIHDYFYNILLTQLAERTTYTFSFQRGYTEDFFTAKNLGFARYHRALGEISHRLLEKMTVGLRGSYEWVKYSTEAKDHIWRVGPNSSYDVLKWLSLSLEGYYQQNHSNIQDRDYTEYRGIFRVTATY
jgi:hypothetical protein